MANRLDPPQHYDSDHRAVWTEAVTRLTSSGRVFRADVEVLAAYVEAVISHRQASRILAQEDVTIQDAAGRVSENPALTIQRRCAEELTRASKALGLDRIAGDDPSMTVPGPASIHDGLCGGKKKQGEGTCTQPAGWGTPHVGTGRCKLHGGNAPSSIAKGIEDQAAKLLYQYGAPPVIDHLAALQALAGRALALEEYIGGEVNKLRSLRYEGGAGGEQLRGEVQVLERAMDRAGRLLVDIAKLNIESRLAGVREATLRMLDEALTIALQKSGADISGQTAARDEFKKRVRVVA
jgi:P27 family predicted phage terminase small subunit